MTMPLETRPESTCWTLIRSAASGDPADREAFSRRYVPVVRLYVSARLRLPIEHPDVEDASQEVFIDFLKEGGALERADPSRAGGFRAFVYGISRKAAALVERRRSRQREVPASDSYALEGAEQDETSLDAVFDRAWAELVTSEARALMEVRAGRVGSGGALLRVIRLRYDVGLKPGEIASRMHVDVNVIYRLLERGKKEFRASLVAVMAVYHPDDTESELERRCADLLSVL